MKQWRRLWRRDFSARLRRAEALTAARDWARALQAWRRLARDEGAAIAPTALAECARCCLHLGRLAEARDILARVLELEPRHPLANKLLGWVAAEQQDWPVVAAQWRGILASLNLSPSARGLSESRECGNGAAIDGGGATTAASAPSHAEGIASALGPATPDLLQALQALATALIYLGDFTEAEALLARLRDLGGEGSDAEREALRLQADLATLRLDFDGQRRAWQLLHEKHPAAARGASGWRGFAGLEDRPEAPRYTADDLRQAAKAADAQLILHYLRAHLPPSELLPLAREAAAAFPAKSSPEERALHRDCVDVHLAEFGTQAEYAAMQAQVRDFCAGKPDYRHILEMRLLAAVAADDADSAADLLQRARALLGGHLDLVRLELWLAAKRGDHKRAYAIARQLGRRRYIPGMDNRGLDLRPLNAVPADVEWRRRQDRILLFTAFRNERLFAPWFIDYYRELGVERFFIVDNLSKDGTAEFLSAQQDVTVFSSRDPFVATVSGTQWINELIRRYGQDNWCVYVDSDEELVLPAGNHSPQRGGVRQRLAVGGGGATSVVTSSATASAGGGSPLRRFVDGMAARGEEALPAYMLDTFPADMAAVRDFQPGDAPLAVSNLIDTDYLFSGHRYCPFLRVRGGVRQRLFGLREQTEKAPILRGGHFPDGDTLRLYIDNHKLNYARTSPQCGALLHHKLLREAIEMQQGKASTYRMQTRLRQRQRMHEQYRASGYLSPTAQIPRTPHTVAFESPAQLQRLGLLGRINQPRPV